MHLFLGENFREILIFFGNRRRIILSFFVGSRQIFGDADDSIEVQDVDLVVGIDFRGKADFWG